MVAHTQVKHLDKWSSWSKAKDPDGYVVDVESATEPGGKPIARFMSVRPSQKNSFASIFADFSPENYSGKKFEYTAWIKTDNVTDAAELWATAEDDNDIIAFDDMSNRAVRGTSDWKKYSIVLSVPPTSKRLRVGFMLRGSGVARFKEPSVTEAPADAKTTEIPFSEKAFVINNLDDAPRNLSFGDNKYTAADRNNVLNHWATNEDEGFKVGLDHDVLRQGKPGLCINGKDSDAKGFGSVYQIFSARDYRNKRARLSGYIKTASVKDWSGLFMQVDAENRILAFDAMEDRPLKGDHEWTKCDLVLDVPANARKIKIGFLQAGPGKSWLADCDFDTVDKTVPTTGKPVADDKFPPMHLLSKPFLDFE